MVVTAYLLCSVHLVTHCHKVLLYKGQTVCCFNTQTYLHEWPARKVLAETAETVHVCDLCSGVHIITNPKRWTGKTIGLSLFYSTFTLKACSIQSEARHNFKTQNLLKPGLTLWVPAGTAWVSTLYTLYTLMFFYYFFLIPENIATKLSLCQFACFGNIFQLFSVLQLRLQQRRTREQLVDQGIMPRK